MRNLARNQQPIFYRLYEGEEEIIDEYGNPSGEYAPKYGPLQSAMLCVSPNKGTSETEQFGSIENYDRTVTTADTSLEIDENTILWVDGADTDGPWNYEVKAVARWFNSLQYAIAQVNVRVYESTKKKMEAAEKAKARIAQQQTEAAHGEDSSEPTECGINRGSDSEGESVQGEGQGTSSEADAGDV